MGTISVTETAIHLNKIQTHIINSVVHDGWSDEFRGKKVREAFEKSKQYFAENMYDIILNELTFEELETYGFRLYKKFWCVPHWLFKLLPDETILKSVTTDELTKKPKASDDTRDGCVLYTLPELKTAE